MGLSASQVAWLKQVAPSAEYASEKTGISAGVILTQWSNESAFGTSAVAVNNNNYGGIEPGFGNLQTGSSGGYDTFSSFQNFVNDYIQGLNNNSRYQSVENAGKSGASFAKQAQLLGSSGYASGQYNAGSGPGSSLDNLYSLILGTPGLVSSLNQVPGTKAGETIESDMFPTTLGGSSTPAGSDQGGDPSNPQSSNTGNSGTPLFSGLGFSTPVTTADVKNTGIAILAGIIVIIGIVVLVFHSGVLKNLPIPKLG